MRIASSRFIKSMVVALGISLPGQDFLELPWRVNDKGLLEVQQGVPPTGGGNQLQYANWFPMFPGLFEKGFDGEAAGFGELPSLGPMVVLPLLLHGDGGAAAIVEAKHRMQKLGIRVAIDRAAMHSVRPDPLLDLLRVRRMDEAGVPSALSVLLDYAEDPRRDVFVRAAAASFLKRHDVGDRFTGLGEWRKSLTRRNGAAALQAGLSRLPDDADVVLGIHCAAIPSLSRLLVAWRKFVLRYSSFASIHGGGNLSPGVLAGVQRRFDLPGQLPYELAVRFGNWRVDYALFAGRWGSDDGCWLHLGGVFQPALLAKGLRDAGCEAELSDDGELVAEVYGWHVRAGKSALEAWPTKMKVGKRGGRLADLHDWANPGRPAVTALVTPACELARSLGVVGDGLVAQFDPATMSLTAKATCSDADAATSMQRAWQAWQAKRRFDPEDKALDDEHITWGTVASWGPGVGGLLVSALAWRRCVQAIDVRVDNANLAWSGDLSVFPLADLVRLLSAPPQVMVERW